MDPHTLAYLELVSHRQGQAAINAWTRYVGWRDADLKHKVRWQLTVEERLALADAIAGAWRMTVERGAKATRVEEMSE